MRLTLTLQQLNSTQKPSPSLTSPFNVSTVTTCPVPGSYPAPSVLGLEASPQPQHTQPKKAYGSEMGKEKGGWNSARRHRKLHSMEPQAGRDMTERIWS